MLSVTYWELNEDVGAAVGLQDKLGDVDYIKYWIAGDIAVPSALKIGRAHV